VSWLGNVIGFRYDDDDREIVPTEFDFAIIPDPVFVANPICPHCQSPAHPEMVHGVEEYDSTHPHLLTVLGDLLMCTDCTQTFLVVEFPDIKYGAPIMTRWSVPDRLVKKN
jgi:hypothetical protein